MPYNTDSKEEIRRRKQGDFIQEKRKKLGLSQEKLADELGVSAQAVSNWERGTTEISPGKLHALAQLLKVSTADILDAEIDREFQVAWSDRVFDENELAQLLRGYFQGAKMAQAYAAIGTMEAAHSDMKRKGTDQVPHSNHPLTMARHAWALGLKDDDLLTAILLHDAIDCDGYEIDSLQVSGRVKAALRALKKPDAYAKDKAGENADETAGDWKAAYYEQVAGDEIATLVKIFSRCNNVSAVATGFERKLLPKYIDETELYVLPLIDKLENNMNYADAAFVLKYHMKSVIETAKRLI